MTVENLIRHAALAKRVLEGTRQPVRAIQNRKIFGLSITFLNRQRNRISDVSGFILRRRVGDQPNRLAFVVGRDERFLFSPNVVFDQLVSDAQDRFGAAVVLFQSYDRNRRIVFLKIKNVRNIGTAPTVDRLVGVTRDGKVLHVVVEQSNQLILSPIRVLVFVHHHVSKLQVQAFTKLRIVAQQVDAVQQ